MKTYTIINTDIMLNGKIFPEGSTIELDDNEAELLSDYLILISNNKTKKVELELKKRSK